MKTSYIALAAGLVAFAPAMASADSVAASLSASFGAAPNAVIIESDGSGTTTSFSQPTSISTSAAAGTFAVSTGVATGSSSGTSAGATTSDEFTPFALIEENDNSVYETTVAFQQILDVQGMIDDSIDIALTDLCAGLSAGTTNISLSTEEFRAIVGSGTITTSGGIFDLPLNSVDVGGTIDIEVTCP